MKIHRFYSKEILNKNIAKGEEIALSDASLVHQLKNVFRFQGGEEVILLDGNNNEYLCDIKDIQKDIVVLNIKDNTKTVARPKREITLFISIPKKDNFEMILQKCTELGIQNFVPIISDRTEKKNINLERAQKILIEAVEQSGFGIIPKIHEPLKISEALEQDKNSKKIALNIEAQTNFLDATESSDESISIYIGPEGGWTDNDLQTLKESGCKISSLGQQTLRVETAAIAAASLLLLK